MFLCASHMQGDVNPDRPLTPLGVGGLGGGGLPVDSLHRETGEGEPNSPRVIR